ncbi:MAG TPA: Uma2 family endonuclease [Bryobacteraceae bacterium]|jgi:Uma2 family endonuclease|nr:Uma2 family endonuclease [Bryobacteraceae bacterium]
MIAASAVPLAEYLGTAYDPDCEYIDGQVVQRSVGEYPHSRVQGLLYAYFLRRRKPWGVTPIIEQRVQVTPTTFLVPDICVLSGPEPATKIVTEPPLIWIEVLSSEDRPVRVSRKVRQAIQFGAAYVWVIDPETLESYVTTQEGEYDLVDQTLRIPTRDIVVPLPAIDED